MRSEDFLSKEWRVNHLYKIADKGAQLRIFKEYPAQKIIRTEPTRIAQILKSRQMGITTGCLIDLLDYTIFHPNTTTMILAHKKTDLPKIFDKVRLAWKSMKPRIRPILDKGGGSRYEMRCPDINSKIFADIENRGDTIHRLHVSEAAFVEPSRLRATLGAVVPNGRITYESTPNGMGNDFYRHWANPKSTRAKLFFPWYLQEEYSLEDHNLKKKDLTIEEKELIEKARKNHGIQVTLNRSLNIWEKSGIRSLMTGRLQSGSHIRKIRDTSWEPTSRRD